MKDWKGYIIFGFMFLFLGVLIFVAVHRVEVATERRIFAEISDYQAVRAKNPQFFKGYSQEEKERIERVASVYYFMPELLAAYGPTENGWLQNETGYNGTHKLRVRLLFKDPKDWPWASTCELMAHVGAHRLQTPEQMGPWLTDVGKVYNPKSAEWTRHFTEFVVWYQVQRKIPTRSETTKPKGRHR